MRDTKGILAGKTVMNTGASSGVGEAAARLFAAEGAAVLLMARREDVLNQLAREMTDSGGRAAVSRGDVAVPEDVQRAVDAAREHFGSPGRGIQQRGLLRRGPVPDA
ncbi:SDR family NAD(P)-dependent oxidoreductase [Streptomyces iconiensis]|uniref:SDR family NAD(P)-dependent oxidoreductase n=1 Tax=Streptomyces iconiensis TaxID=1384038 RepID=A0ABT7A196_9ACTN|nr:SDR family NAD(P)-dependent oxidoreductase [Streptomyces iconiensis]MDJ1135108.1 SDR family NAD(P)-dependent oxidoreductase [Streptomyces iconiensis]